MKILIVDDKPENLYLLELILKGSGYITISAKNGAEALEMARKDIPDLIITDILMPVMDGFTLCREFKKDDRLCMVPLIFYTATYTDPKDEEFALDLGADRFIVKPKEPEEFITIVEEVLKEVNSKTITGAHAPLIPDQLVLKEYNETLVRKLEDKMLQAELSEKKVRKYNITLLREIEERKQKEELLRKSEKQISLIYDTVGDSIFNLKVEKDGSYIFASVNQCFLETTGLQSSQIIGKQVNEIIPEPSLSLVLEKYSEAIRERKIVRWEETTQYPTGELVGEVSVAPVFDKKMNCTSLVGSVHDITERKRAEEALRKSETKYRELIDGMTDTVWVIDLHGNVIDVNDSAVKILGYSKEELINIGLFGIDLSLSKEDIKTLVKAMPSNKVQTFETNHTTKDGRTFPVEISSTLVTYLGNLAILSIARDITERKWAEEEIKKANRVYAFLSNINQTIVHVRNKETIYSEVCRIAVDIGKFKMAWIGMVDPQTNKVYPAASAGYTNEYLKTLNIDLNDKKLCQGPTGQSIKSGIHHLANDINNNPEMMPWKENALRFGYNSSAAFPIKVFNQVIGAFMLYAEERFFFNENEVALLDEVVMDISFAVESIEIEKKRKNAEEALTANEIKYRSFFENSMDAIFLTSPDGKILSANPAAGRLFGYSNEEFISLGRSGIVDIADPKLPVLLSERASKGKAQGELTMIRKDGTYFDAEISSAIFKNQEGHENTSMIIRDISERKLAEKALHDSIERYKNLTDISPVGIFHTDENGLTTFVNPKWCQIAGLSVDKALGYGWLDAVHPDDREKIINRWREATQLYTTSFSDYRFVHPDGTIAWVMGQAIPEKNSENQIVGYIGTITDITERKKVEESLTKNEKLYRSLFENMLNGFAYCQMHFDENDKPWDFTYLSVNSAFEALTGLKNVAGKKVTEVIPGIRENDPDLLEKYGCVAKTGKSERFEIFVDSLQMWFWISLYSPERGYFVAVFDVITERKLAEEKLSKSEEKYRGIFENVQDVYYEASFDGTILEVSPSIEIMSKGGYHREDLIGKSMYDFYSITNGREALLAILNERGSVTDYGIILINKDGSQVPCSISAKIQLDTHGVPWKIIGSMRDITERKQAEEALLESEAKYRTLVTKSPDGIFVVDLTGTFLSVNKSMCDNLKYSEEELLSMKMWDIVPKQYLALHRDRLTAIIKGESKKEAAEYEVIGKDGIVLFIEVLSAPYYKDKKVIGFQGIARDITEKKRVEEVLQENEKRFRELFDYAPIGYHELDIHGRITHVNSTELNMLGYSEEEMVGQFVWEFLGDKVISKQRVSEKLKGLCPPAKSEERIYRRKDQTIIPVLVEDKILFDTADHIIGIRTTLQDITERKHTEETLQKLSSAVEQTVDAIVITDRNGTIEYVNPSFEDLTGYSAEEVLGKTPRILKSGKLNRKYYEGMWNTILSGNVFIAELINKKRNGDLYYEEKTISPIFDKNKNITHFVGTGVDITERKLTEKKLIEAKERAEQSDKLKTEFLAQMSHEIRSPMNAILSFANILKEEVEGKLTPDYLQYFDGIDSAGQRLMRTVELILNASEMQVGTYEPSFKKFDLMEEVIEKAKKDYTKLINEKGLQVNFISEVPEAIVVGDQYSIYQIFVNLIDNAVKFTNEGSILIKVEKDENEKAIKVIIEDTGIGMSEEFLNRIYQPFTQEDRGYSRKFDGSGLGLSLVKKYCDLNGIAIAVETKKGEGSKFTLTFAGAK